MRGIGNTDAKSDFVIKFDRLYKTQQYLAAFDLCVQNINTSYKTEVASRAKSLFPKIKGKIELANRNMFYDEIVDILSPLGYKMKYNSKGVLKVSTISVERLKNGNKMIINFRKPYIKNFLIAVLFIFILFILEAGIIGNLLRMILEDCMNIREEQAWFILIPFMILIGFIMFYWLYRIIYRKPRKIVLQFLNALIK